MGAIAGGGESGGFGDAVAEEGRLGVIVEGEEDGDAGVIRPGVGCEFGAHGDGVHCVEDLLIGPEGAGLGDGLRLALLRGGQTGDEQEDEEKLAHAAAPGWIGLESSMEGSRFARPPLCQNRADVGHPLA